MGDVDGKRLTVQVSFKLHHERCFEKLIASTDPEDETAAFYSRPEDIHVCTSTQSQEKCIAFCTASSNSKYTKEVTVVLALVLIGLDI
jgi:hypothetical protein